jgi:hypothetical protein
MKWSTMVRSFGYGARVSTLSSNKSRILLTRTSARMQPSPCCKVLDIYVHRILDASFMRLCQTTSRKGESDTEIMILGRED